MSDATKAVEPTEEQVAACFHQAVGMFAKHGRHPVTDRDLMETVALAMAARVAELEREVVEARAEGRREMREAAARICDSSAKGWREDSGTPVVALGLTMAARTIRALPDTPTPTDPA